MRALPKDFMEAFPGLGRYGAHELWHTIRVTCPEVLEHWPPKDKEYDSVEALYYLCRHLFSVRVDLDENAGDTEDDADPEEVLKRTLERRAYFQGTRRPFKGRSSR